MARTKRKSAVLEAARKRLAGLKAIENPNFGANLTEAIYTAKINSLSARLDGYNTLLSQVDEEQNDLEKEEAETNELSRRFLAAGEAQYGPDSNEYEMLGGTRTSDRKKPSKKSGGSSGTGSGGSGTGSGGSGSGSGGSGAGSGGSGGGSGGSGGGSGGSGGSTP